MRDFAAETDERRLLATSLAAQGASDVYIAQAVAEYQVIQNRLACAAPTDGRDRPSLSYVLQKPSLQRTLAGPPKRHWMDRVIVLFALSAIVAAICISLAGCQTGRPYYTPDVLINGFDPTLTSHQKALGLDH